MKKICKKHFYLIRKVWKQSPAFFYLLLLLPFFSCSDDNENVTFNPSLPVTVSGVIPDSGTISLPLVIHGSNFGTDKSKIKVFFDNKEAVIINAQNEHLYVLNPKQEHGKHSVRVVVNENNEGKLANKQFKYIVTSSVSTVAGLGEQDVTDGPALEATFGQPDHLSVDDKGNILVTDYRHYYIRLVSLSDNKVTTLIDDEQIYGGCFSNDYTHFYVAVENKIKMAHDYYRPGNWAHGLIVNDGSYDDQPCALAIDDHDDIFVIGYYGSFCKIDHASHAITNMGSVPSFVDAEADGDGVDYYMAYNPHDKHLYISSRYQNIIFRIDARKAQFEEADFELYAGTSNSSGFNNGPRETATFNSPQGIDFDSEGNMYIADFSNDAIRKITPEGMVSTYAGGQAGHKDGIIEEAMFRGPADVAVSPEDFIYVADYLNYRIRCIAVQ